MAVDWKIVGLPRWYDCKLGRIKDQTLARLVGISKNRIRARRLMLGIAAYTVDQAIEPFRDLLGVESDPVIAARCGVSVSSVTTYRESLGIAPLARPTPRKQRIPANHPVRPYKALLGLVSDQDIAKLSDVPVATVKSLREAFGFEPAAPLPELPRPDPVPDYQGPWLGYESLFGTMSSAKISRAVGVPLAVVEQRREFLGVKPYQRVSRAARYKHLFGVVPNNVLAKLAGVSPARIADMRTRASLGN
ncbi:hypothetical protein N7D90_24605 (plasmid) [Pseudomonas fragi]|uniref:hypothetical protein n=1 Tax=Pseudomonas fragi TaxID=296 RepID=UPI0021BF7E37|nr:hypothetical protein [Pseudomonas fragi]UXL41043.1 hypothetical protein N7D90_24605 [Pseudomonas fragi]